MSRRYKKQDMRFSPQAFSKLVDCSMPPKPTYGYQFGYPGYLSDDMLGKDTKVRTHPSGLFLTKGHNGVVLDSLLYGVKFLRIVQKDADGWYNPIRTNGYKVFYFHDLPQLLEIEVDRVIYNANSGQYDDGFYLFRYDSYRREFIEVEYDPDEKRLVDKE